MGTYSKIILSGSTDGQGIRITATTPSGTIVHTCVTGAAESIDEMWVYGHSTVTTTAQIVFAFGVTTATGSRLTHTVSAGDKAGLILMIPGLVGRNTKILKASATSTDRFNLFGYVNRYAS